MDTYQNYTKIFNSTEMDFPKEKSLIQLFEEQVEKTPQNIALKFEDKVISYKEFNEKSNQMARMLFNSGIRRNSVVGIMLPRCFEMVIGIYAILKAGASYLPIDIDLPIERIKHILIDSNVSSVIILGEQDKINGLVPLLNVAEQSLYNCYDTTNLNLDYSSNDLAYIIYTSGSTGKPKGVMVEHISVVNNLNWMKRKYSVTKSDIILLKTSFSFDVSIWELFLWSTVGASLVILEPIKEKDPRAIINKVKDEKISLIHFVPTVLEFFIEYVELTNSVDKLKSIRHIFASGEEISISIVKKTNELLFKANKIELHNLYGPTETTIHVTSYNCSKIPLDYNTVPIGKPIDNTKMFVLDPDCRPVPIGVEGELYISGICLARGYMNNNEITNESFIVNPFNESTKMYKTGDYAKWLSSGNLIFLGRCDSQVKIRGLRIELGEIENCLIKNKNIKKVKAIVNATQWGNKIVAFYCTYTNQEIEENELINFMTKELPLYMVPSSFIYVDKFITNNNGKIDLKYLKTLIS